MQKMRALRGRLRHYVTHRPAFYLDGEGILKMQPEISARLHQNPAVFAVESACILQHYREGIHLDIGCGSRKITARAIGVDIDDGKRPFLEGTVNIIAAADDLCMFTDESVGFISAIHSFEHVPDPRETLNEWYRVLAPGGRFGIVVPDKKGPIPDRSLLTDHTQDYDAGSLRRLVEDPPHRFEILALDTLENGWSIDIVAEKSA